LQASYEDEEDAYRSSQPHDDDYVDHNDDAMLPADGDSRCYYDDQPSGEQFNNDVEHWLPDDVVVEEEEDEEPLSYNSRPQQPPHVPRFVIVQSDGSNECGMCFNFFYWRAQITTILLISVFL
jgi:hypothetical protein